jgi:hypothetical protein
LQGSAIKVFFALRFLRSRRAFGFIFFRSSKRISPQSLTRSRTKNKALALIEAKILLRFFTEKDCSGKQEAAPEKIK